MNAIETDALTRRFGDRLAVDGLTIAIPQGSIVGFLGPNGAGKTTTVRMLAALVAPTSGSAVVAGHRLGVNNDAIRASIGILTESPGLYGTLSARQNLRFFARLHCIDDRDIDARIDRYLRMLGLAGRDNERVADHSKGMRQKLAIARALLHDPPVIFLDEPTSALDPESAHTVREFIRMLREEGRTILLATHNLAEADELCDTIALFRTRLLRIDTPLRLRESTGTSAVLIRLTSDASAFVERLRALDVVTSANSDARVLTIDVDNIERDIPVVVRELVSIGAGVIAVEHRAKSLEDVYLELMASHAGDEL